MINSKILLEAQKSDKTLIKHLDVQLINIQLYLKKLLNIQNEWTRIENILTVEQKWLNEFDKSTLDIIKITSDNYFQMLCNTQVNKIFNTINIFCIKLLLL